jgi:hypothetical protein
MAFPHLIRPTYANGNVDVYVPDPSGGGKAGSYPHTRQCAMHATTRPSAHVLYFTPVALNISLRWVDDNVRARPSQWEGGHPEPLTTKCQIRRSIALDHRPRPIYDAMLMTWGLYFSPRMENGVHTCTTSSGGGGWPNPHPRQVQPGHVMTLQSPTCVL